MEAVISEEGYYKRAFEAARARGDYVGAGEYRSKEGKTFRVRTFEAWQERPALGNLEEVQT